jgi:hypothetical protein
LTSPAAVAALTLALSWLPGSAWVDFVRLPATLLAITLA